MQPPGDPGACFDTTSGTYEFDQEDWWPSTDTWDDLTEKDLHCTPEWAWYCFGPPTLSCYRIRRTIPQYGCGAIRARVSPDPQQAFFDAPLLRERRLPALVEDNTDD